MVGLARLSGNDVIGAEGAGAFTPHNAAVTKGAAGRKLPGAFLLLSVHEQDFVRFHVYNAYGLTKGIEDVAQLLVLAFYFVVKTKMDQGNGQNIAHKVANAGFFQRPRRLGNAPGKAYAPVEIPFMQNRKTVD